MCSVTSVPEETEVSVVILMRAESEILDKNTQVHARQMVLDELSKTGKRMTIM
jgi:hypothetical protein